MTLGSVNPSCPFLAGGLLLPEKSVMGKNPPRPPFAKGGRNLWIAVLSIFIPKTFLCNRYGIFHVFRGGPAKRCSSTDHLIRGQGIEKII